MREVIVKHYQFEELDDKAKETAREWFREGESEMFGAHGEINEPLETAAKLLGIEFDGVPVKLMGGGMRTEPDIRWSGFGCQGDGASFVGCYGHAKGAAKRIRAEFPTDTVLHGIADELAGIQKRNGYRVSARVRQMTVEVFKGDKEAYADGSSEQDSALAAEVLDAMRRFAQWIYDYLQQEYEYRMSDESVDESIRANEYEFLENGRRAV